MPAAYSEDLRERVITFVAGGGKQTEAARVFGLGYATIARWLSVHRRTGKVTAHKQGRKLNSSRVTEAALRAYLRANPDANLQRIGQHFGVSAVMIWKRLQQIGYRFKKRHFSMPKEMQKSASSSNKK